MLYLTNSISASVIYLPLDLKPLAAVVAAFEAFVIFPWWFGVIHLFADYDKNRFRGNYLVSASHEFGHHPLSYVNSGTRTSLSNSHTRSVLIWKINCAGYFQKSSTSIRQLKSSSRLWKSTLLRRSWVGNTNVDAPVECSCTGWLSSSNRAASIFTPSKALNVGKHLFWNSIFLHEKRDPTWCMVLKREAL